MTFKGKHVVLTGGSSGIGLALTEILSQRGARVSSLDVEPMKRAIDGVTHIHCDVSRFDDVRMALAQTGGSIDLLLSNAGIMRRGSLLEGTEGDFDALFGVHVKGAWTLTKEAWPLLTKGAHVAFTLSAHALRPPKDPGLYTLSKRAVSALADQLRTHHPEHPIRTLFIGPTDTPLARTDVDPAALKKKEHIMWNVNDVARHIADFLESSGASLSFDDASNDYVIS